MRVNLGCKMVSGAATGFKCRAIRNSQACWKLEVMTGLAEACSLAVDSLIHSSCLCP